MNRAEKKLTATNKMTTSTRQNERSLRWEVCATGKRALTIVGFLCLILFSASAHAQYSSGVEGTVMDATGAVISGAKIQLINVDLGVSNAATSNDSGYFRIDSIPAGRYRLEITAPSFKAYTETGVALDVGQVRSFSPN